MSRRGESGVTVEVYCASMGFNIRKYHKGKIKKEKEARERLKQEKALEKPETSMIHKENVDSSIKRERRIIKNCKVAIVNMFLLCLKTTKTTTILINKEKKRKRL